MDEKVAVKRRSISDRYVFAKVMQDNHDLCKEVVECVLDIEVGRLEAVEVESEIAGVMSHGARYDVYLKGEQGAFEVEMQAYDADDLPLRIRYYRSMLDRRLLARGERYDALKPVYIIFICTGDPFGRGLPVYTFRTRCDEDVAVEFDDRALGIVLSARGDLSRARPEVAALLEYVATGEPGEDGLARKLQAAVDAAYDDESWVKELGNLQWEIDDAKKYAAREARAEGLAAGRAEGFANGRAEGLEQGLFEGREKGLAEGREEGRKKGREEGCARAQQQQIQIVQALTAAGCPPEEIVASMVSGEMDALAVRYGVAVDG